MLGLKGSRYAPGKNVLLYVLCFDMYFSIKKVIALHHGDNNFLFWHLCQIHSFSNNLNDEEKITSQLLYDKNVATFMLQPFCDKKYHICTRKSQYQINPGRAYFMQKQPPEEFCEKSCS